MTGTREQPRGKFEGDTARHSAVADAARNNWVDRYAPHVARPYLRLMRADRPIGFWLLFWPCSWSLTLASMERHDPWLNAGFLTTLLLFFIGSVVMRGAGCVWNDITDRHIDGKVGRTRSRPIPSKQVSVRSAVMFMLVLCAVGLAVLLQFNVFAVGLGFSSLLIVAIYPFMKRFTNWPQAVLGLAFGWGALMGWAAQMGSLDVPALLLYVATISWIIGYDTIYAHQDREDDALIGMKSTALKFGDNTPNWLSLFFGLTIVFLMAAAMMVGAGAQSMAVFVVIFLGMGGAAGLLVWQIVTLDINDADNCLDRFRHAHIFGAVVFFTLLAMWFV
jgi:4-hydroxybenzoate polyprenyltransferase